MSWQTYAQLAAIAVAGGLAGYALARAIKWLAYQLAHLDDHLQDLDGISPLDHATLRAQELDL